MNGYLTVKEAAQYLNMHPETIRRKIRKGQIKSTRVPGTHYIRLLREDLDKFMRGEE